MKTKTKMHNQKKTLIMIAALLLAAMILPSCSASDVEVPDGMKLISSDEEAFYLFVPMSWVTNSSMGMASAYYSDKDRSNISMTCMAPTDAVASLDGYVEYCKAELEAYMPGFEVVGETEDAVLGGRNGRSFTYRASINNIDYKYRQVVVTYQSMFYIFTYTSTLEGYELHADEVETMISKVLFK